jgi:hypothetical protein
LFRSIEPGEKLNEREGCVGRHTGLPLDSAPSGRDSTNDSEQALDLNPNHGDLSSRVGFGGDQQKFADLTFVPDPFRQAPEADRENTLGYSWPPHLYQGIFKVEEKRVGVNEGVALPIPQFGRPVL